MTDSKLILEQLETALNPVEGEESKVAEWIKGVRQAAEKGEKFEVNKAQNQKFVDIAYGAYAKKRYDLGDAIFYNLITDFNTTVLGNRHLNLLCLLSHYDINKERVEYAIKHGADIYAEGVDKKPSFVISLEAEALEVFKVYYSKDKSILRYQNERNNDLLKISAKAKKAKSFEHVLNLSIKNGVDLLNKKNKLGKMILHTIANIPMAPVSSIKDELATYDPHKGVPHETIKAEQAAINSMVTMLSKHEKSFKAQLNHEDDKRKRPYDYCKSNAPGTFTHIESIEKNLFEISTANGIRDGSKLALFEQKMSPQKSTTMPSISQPASEKPIGVNGNGNHDGKIGLR
ncbi:MAG: hypothetical protein KGH59_01840 [Candidatus Micrarchaeota archaeon]|nr:hypothetical protein [Candidatus Micrarchaeota archaeon]MDE1804505.1 hypothetical protein [Candidatus Micrarchaeota archaeon]MDE1846438.1 hypothetical protein [Candidatus Micrarchaeota archaeon]